MSWLLPIVTQWALAAACCSLIRSYCWLSLSLSLSPSLFLSRSLQPSSWANIDLFFNNNQRRKKFPRATTGRRFSLSVGAWWPAKGPRILGKSARGASFNDLLTIYLHFCLGILFLSRVTVFNQSEERARLASCLHQSSMRAR